MRKKWIEIGLCISLVLSLLSGCGKNGKTTETVTQTAAETVTQAATEPATKEESAVGDTTAALTDKETVSFETTDLEGNSVKSADLFAKNKLTMINFWGTYCNPCIGEMPELAALSESLKAENVGIVGIVIDTIDGDGNPDPDGLAVAKQILHETGVTYLNLNYSVGMTTLDVSAIPTSYLVDEKGNIVGESVVGARGKEDYKKWIEETLQTIGGNK